MGLEDWSMLIKANIMDSGTTARKKEKACLSIQTKISILGIGSMVKSMDRVPMSSMQLVWNISENGSRIDSVREDGPIQMEVISKDSSRTTNLKEGVFGN